MVIPATIFAALAGTWLYHLMKEYCGRRLTQVIAIIFMIIVAGGGYREYFIIWARNPNVPRVFAANYVDIGNQINALAPEVQKYVIVEATGMRTYGIPWQAQTVMFVTNSFVANTEAQKDVKNIHYLLPSETGQIPPGTPTNTIFYIK
jgi:hypothetical protein